MQETLEVHVPKGAPDGHKIHFSEKADEIPDGEAGDVTESELRLLVAGARRSGVNSGKSAGRVSLDAGGRADGRPPTPSPRGVRAVGRCTPNGVRRGAVLHMFDA